LATTREFRCDYRLRQGRAIDVGAGFFITRRVAARFTFTSVTHRGPATLWVHETNMWGSAGVSGEGSFTPGRDFQRTEDSLNVGAVFAIPLHSRVQATAFAGPTFMRLRQDLMERIYVRYEGDEGTYPYTARPFTLGLSAVEYGVHQARSSGWGYHAGGGAVFSLSRVVGLGVSLRYVGADVELGNDVNPEYGLGPVLRRVKAGGWHLVGGTQLRF
jgi:hypothetical protein